MRKTIIVALFLCLAAPCYANYTIVHQGDIHLNYDPLTWPAQSAWMVDHAADPISAVLSVGDFSAEGDNLTQRARVVFQESNNGTDGFQGIDAAGIPWEVVIGNHDSPDLTGRSVTDFDTWEGSVAHAGKSWWHKMSTFSSSACTTLAGLTGESINSYVLFTAQGDEWIVLGFEIAPRAEAIACAIDIANFYTLRNLAIVTHCLVGRDGSFYAHDAPYDIAHGNNDSLGFSHAGTPPANYDALDIWNAFKGFPNWRLALGGHEGYRFAHGSHVGTHGNIVMALLAMDSLGYLTPISVVPGATQMTIQNLGVDGNTTLNTTIIARFPPARFKVNGMDGVSNGNGLTPLVISGVGKSTNGVVALTNMRLNNVNGSAFVDFNQSSVLTDHIGSELYVWDSTGKQLHGYIKAQGTGETYTELNTNIEMETTVDPYTGNHSALSIEAGGVNNNGLKSTGDTERTYTGIRVPAAAYSAGGLYKIDFWTKNIQGVTSFLYQLTGYLNSPTIPLSGTDWYHYQWYFVGSGASLTSQITYNEVESLPIDSMLDVFHRYQVLTPSTTGVTIVNSLGGSTYNWESAETGFNYNDSLGYTYQIIDQYGTTAVAGEGSYLLNHSSGYVSAHGGKIKLH